MTPRRAPFATVPGLCPGPRDISGKKMGWMLVTSFVRKYPGGPGAEPPASVMGAVPC